MPLPRYVELVRVSSAGQAARDTPADQRRALDALRISRPGVLVERIDSAVSGAKDSDDRADLARLFELAAARAFDELRIRHVDRLTRHPDPRQRAAVFGSLLDAGAVVVEASGRVIDPADEMGELDLHLQGWMASRERKRILERTLAARRRLAGEGKIQGRPPWGRTWDKRTGAWGEDRKAVEVYRRIFAEVIKGRSLREVAEGLNKEGTATPRGREWTPAHVSRLVRARSSTGVMEGWGHLFRIPAIVDEQTWRAALAALARNRQTRAGPPGHHPALLRRVLVCGPCGSKMWVQRGGRPGDVRSFYVCSTYRRATDPDCHRWHSVEEVDRAVRTAILAELRQPARIRAAAAAARKGAVDPLAEARREVERADLELRKLDCEEERLARLARRKLLSDRIASQQLAEVARLRNAAEVEKASALGRVEAIQNAQEAHQDARRSLDAIASALDRATPQRWLQFVREQFPPGYGVRLWPDGAIRVAGLWTATRKAAGML